MSRTYSFLKTCSAVLRIICVSFSVLLSLVFCLYITSEWIFLPPTSQNEPIDVDWKDYQSLTYDSNSEEFYFGTSTEPSKDFESGQFLFSTNENREIYELISPIGEEEYICEGNCYCDDSTQRRTKGGVDSITHRMIYLLVAISSLVAYDLAENYFETKCVNELYDSCSDLLSIKSEVVDCEPVIDRELENEIDQDGSQTNNVPEEEEKQVWRYRCRGTCQVRQEYDYDLFVDDVFSDKGTNKAKRLLEENWEFEASKLIQEEVGSLDEMCSEMVLVIEVLVKVEANKKESDFETEYDFLVWKDRIKKQAYMEFQESMNQFCRSNSGLKKKFGDPIWQGIQSIYFSWLKIQDEKAFPNPNLGVYDEYHNQMKEDTTADELCHSGLGFDCRRLPYT